MKGKGANFWVQIALFNLVVVAILGVMLRYKIAFSFPLIHQKHLLHGHSHFAFSAWVGQMIMTLLAFILRERNSGKEPFEFRTLLAGNTLLAFFMLFAFVYQGYGPISIFFSTVSTAINFLFCFRVWAFIRKSQVVSTGDYYIQASIIFNVLSSIGTMYLAYLMSNKINHPEKYLASVYYYLHFQYNGYFIFSCLGLFAYFLDHLGITLTHSGRVFWLLAGSLAPAYLLSIMWVKLPLFWYVILVLAAIIQFGAWFYWLYQVKKKQSEIYHGVPVMVRFLWILVALATSLKFGLQLLSIIPSLSEYAFGFRPVVIAYLHLVLLGVVSLFLMGFAIWKGYIQWNSLLKWAFGLFVGGIFFNECILMLQGMSFLNLVQIPFSNEILFGVAVLMFLGALGIFVSQKLKQNLI
ncbi:hypothetical protein G9H62_08340 [Aquirufa ecclesiirivi]|uniref:hypothetical protein n=1 Tax=Aquirufa ecclesiirivi TaxID=2715124 RepID=UPI0022A8BE1E|nr:hypothetical protein [Aquirufa ecclesiirivi]MCZ2472845.1 hypothetical protein [Aquirufa ecclesiirivi]